MEHVGGFRLSRAIPTENSTIYIGEIDGQHAIYTLAYPSITKEEFHSGVRFENDTLVLRTKFVPRLIYPATEKHIEKYTSAGRYGRETYEDYRANDDFLRTSWLDNLVRAEGSSGAPCSEDILFENEHYLIIADYKWDRKSSSSLYLLLIFKSDRYRSLREIDDVALLRAAKRDSYRQCLACGVGEEEVCLFFHYRPSYFRLHLHIVNISRSRKYLGSSLRNVLLDDVIKNLEIDPEYYRRDRFLIMYSR